MTGDNDTQREIGRLAGAIEEGFRSSRERYDDMSGRLDRIDVSIKELDRCIDERTETITDLITTQHAAQNERVDAIKKDHGARLTTLEHDKSKVLGGWRALVITWGGAIGASGATVGALKLLGLIR